MDDYNERRQIKKSYYGLFRMLPAELIQQIIDYLNILQLSRLLRNIPYIVKMIYSGSLHITKVIINTCCYESDNYCSLRVDNIKLKNKKVISLFVKYYLDQCYQLKEKKKKESVEDESDLSDWYDLQICKRMTTKISAKNIISAVVHQDIDELIFCNLVSAEYLLLSHLLEKITEVENVSICYHQFIYNIKKIVDYIEIFNYQQMQLPENSFDYGMTLVKPLENFIPRDRAVLRLTLDESAFNNIEVSKNLIPLLLCHKSNKLWEFRQKIIAHKFTDLLAFKFYIGGNFFKYQVTPKNFTIEGLLQL